jgi:hypothetical protein
MRTTRTQCIPSKPLCRGPAARRGAGGTDNSQISATKRNLPQECPSQHSGNHWLRGEGAWLTFPPFPDVASHGLGHGRLEPRAA